MNRAHPAHKCINEHWYCFDFLGMFTVEAEFTFTGYSFWSFQGMCLASAGDPLKLKFTKKELMLT